MARVSGRIYVEDGAQITVLDIRRSKLVPWKNLAVVRLELPGELDKVIRLGVGDNVKISFGVNLAGETPLGRSND